MASKLTGAALEKRRKQVETTSTFGLILICVALAAPFTNPTSIEYLKVFKWIYGSGALIYLVARMVDISDPQESLRVKRLRRMEFWAGIAFGLATAFWFIAEHKFREIPKTGMFAILQNTIMFTLVGALIQIFAAWMIYYRTKKDKKS